MKKIFFVCAVFSAFVLIGDAREVSAQRDGSMTWRGTVDDVVELTIRRRSVRVRTVSGRTYGRGSYDFDGGGMNRNSDRVRVDKQDGRGRVYIVQRPNRRNNWTTVVRIEDRSGGADRYRVRVYWD